VWLARQEALHRKVAIKVLKEEWRGNLAVVTSFQRQARLQARLKHHGLASGIDVGLAKGTPYFVLEHLEGDTVATLLRAGKPIDAGTVTRILRELLETLEYVHGQGQAVKHLHPGSVMLGDAGEVWITSLGFPLPHPGLYPPSRVLELACLAPEAVRDPEAAGVRGDLFALGALGAWMLLGRPPRKAPGVPAMLTQVTSGLSGNLLDTGVSAPASLKAFLGCLVALDPVARPASAAEALGALSQATPKVADERGSVISLGARPVDSLAARRSAPRPARTVGLILAAVLVVASLVLVLMKLRRNGDDRPAVPEENSPKNNVEAPVPDKPADPVPSPPDPTVDEVAAEVAWSEAKAEAESLLAREAHAEALASMNGFTSRFGGSRFAAEALEMARKIQMARLEKARSLIAGAREKLSGGDIEAARLGVLAASDGARSVLPAEVEALEGALAALEAKKAEEASRTSAQNGPGAAPVKPALSPYEIPEHILDRRLQLGLLQPWDQKGHQLLMEDAEVSARSNETLRGRIRLLKALDQGMADVRQKFAARAGREVTVEINGGEKQSGELKAVEDAGLVLDRGGITTKIPWDRLALSEPLRILSTLEPTLERYLTRATLDMLADRKVEAWFDLQGARLLSGNDPILRRHVETWLDELRKAPPRDRNGN
jgi:serine/threonine-protein kinase